MTHTWLQLVWNSPWANATDWASWEECQDVFKTQQQARLLLTRYLYIYTMAWIPNVLLDKFRLQFSMTYHHWIYWYDSPDTCMWDFKLWTALPQKNNNFSSNPEHRDTVWRLSCHPTFFLNHSEVIDLMNTASGPLVHWVLWPCSGLRPMKADPPVAPSK